MTEQEAKEALHEIDRVVKVSSATRDAHMIWAQLMRRIEERVKLSYQLEKDGKNVGTDIQVNDD